MISFVALIASIFFVTYHEYLIYKNVPAEDKAFRMKNLLNAGDGTQSKCEKIMEVIAFICLLMSVFDLNQNILQVKNEMEKPRHFMYITMLSYISFAFMVLSFSTFGYMTFGKHFQSPAVIDNGFYGWDYNYMHKIMNTD